MKPDERERALAGELRSDYYLKALSDSTQFRQVYAGQKTIVKSTEMPWEDSPMGRIKHMVNDQMNTKEYCLDIYQLFLDAGSRSGKHRHLSEEIVYVVEGQGYDLQWDVNFDCQDTYVWDWQTEPQKLEWKTGDFIYIPPYTIHQHFNADDSQPARLVCCTSRIIKAMGFDWFDHLEDAPNYNGNK